MSAHPQPLPRDRRVFRVLNILPSLTRHEPEAGCLNSSFFKIRTGTKLPRGSPHGAHISPLMTTVFILVKPPPQSSLWMEGEGQLIPGSMNTNTAQTQFWRSECCHPRKIHTPATFAGCAHWTFCKHPCCWSAAESRVRYGPAGQEEAGSARCSVPERY